MTPPLRTAATLLGTTLLLVGCGGGGTTDAGPPPVRGTAATLDPGPFLPLGTSDDRRIVDAAGRDVILRGVEHHALQDVDYQGREVRPEDYATIASWGFTVLRVAISWSRIEPVRGSYDDGYLAEIRDVLDRAQAAGLAVILEWHQDLWGRCSQAPDSALRESANGAPDWTCPPDFVPSALGHWDLFDRLWANEDGLMDSLVAAWQHVAQAFADHPAVLGWEPMNEPQGNGDHLATMQVFPFYRHIVRALRDAGARGLFFLDAPILRNESFEMETEPLGDLGPGAVFAPHLYSGWIQLYVVQRRVIDRNKQRDFDNAMMQADALGLPLWDGEWGVNLTLDGSIDDMKTHVGLEEQDLIGSSYWAFERAWHTGEVPSAGAQSLYDEDGTPRQDAIDTISRPYPIATPGRLRAVHWDFDQHVLTVEADIDPSIDAPMILYAPARHLGAMPVIEVHGPAPYRYMRDGDRILLAFDTPGRYQITLHR